MENQEGNKMTEIVLKKLPKISLNNWYSGSHWANRKKIKDIYKIIIKSQIKTVFADNEKYKVNYSFFFKNKPLDATNCVAMVKLIEDVIFENDGYKIVKEISINSNKGLKDFVVINVLINN